MGSYRYSGHVKVVGIVEIVLQAIFWLLELLIIGLVAFGVSIANHFSGNSGGGTTIPNENASAGTSVFSGLFIAILVISVLGNAFGTWMVYLVFTGGQQENPTRLSVWYILESILFSIGLIFIIVFMRIFFVWYFIILCLSYCAYRIYSIHVVRVHAAEIKINGNLPLNIQIQ